MTAHLQRTRGNDLTIYSTYAAEWWTPGAPRFRSLQNISPFRLELIRAGCGVMSGKVVYDIGCGGGLLAVPLLDDGATVTGVDISGPSIEVAARAAGGRGTFLVGDARAVPLPSASADIVLLADVVDHIPDYELALAEAARVLRIGGTLFVGTLNRTAAAYFGAIVLGEGLRLIPPGTHRYDLFVKPEELRERASRYGLAWRRTFGESVSILDTVRRWAITLRRGTGTAVAYSMVFTRSK